MGHQMRDYGLAEGLEVDELEGYLPEEWSLRRVKRKEEEFWAAEKGDFRLTSKFFQNVQFRCFFVEVHEEDIPDELKGGKPSARKVTARRLRKDWKDQLADDPDAPVLTADVPDEPVLRRTDYGWRWGYVSEGGGLRVLSENELTKKQLKKLKKLNAKR